MEEAFCIHIEGGGSNVGNMYEGSFTPRLFNWKFDKRKGVVISLTQNIDRTYYYINGAQNVS